MSPELCRFSAAGNDDLTARSDDRRLKSAKARNRVGRQWEGGAAEERRSKKAMEIWSRDRASGDLGRLSEVEQGYNLDVPARMLLNRGISRFVPSGISKA
jgi:hypothetical protein